MALRIARRAALAAASVTIAATGLLTTGGPASAAAHPTDGRTAVVSHHVQLLDALDDSRSRDAGRAGNDEDARRRWVNDQIEWALHHDPATQQMNDDDARRRWVNDQIEWTLHHNPATHRTNDGNDR
ncbi:hypothetical protein OG894_00475 [Streptomyces sp. NBC_01724]|uniref:hypothetical protein n=1 Tax=unclassified Streptomyces TaxID=2593676 RepID=UPI002E304F50|nr:hypothetical protein [Streptomyces sp. NBC_01724]WTE57381.1 hypothetical protein OG784_00450 [Streptomyces sp. NBC_01617]WTE64747.1 hypothetical protein OG784_41895 [Streptomyces sp. NBC_01617]